MFTRYTLQRMWTRKEGKIIVCTNDFSRSFPSTLFWETFHYMQTRKMFVLASEVKQHHFLVPSAYPS